MVGKVHPDPPACESCVTTVHHTPRETQDKLPEPDFYKDLIPSFPRVAAFLLGGKVLTILDHNGGQ